MKTTFIFRTILALGIGLLFALAQESSAQSTAVSDLPTFTAALGSQNSTVITNFATNAIIGLTTVGEMIQIHGNVTIDGGTNDVTFEGNTVTRLFYVQPGATLTLNNLQLNGGVSTNGGAIYNAGTLIISNCVLYGNSVTNASGVSGATNTDSSGNGQSGTSGGSAAGGAIYSRGPVTILYSILTNNTATAGSGGNGADGVGGGFVFGGNGGNGGNGGSAQGAALFSTSVSNTIYMTEFVNNTCTAGSGGTGGGFASAPFSGTGGAGGAGGSSLGGAAFIQGQLFMTNCVFAQNSATGGGSAGAEVDSDGTGGSASPGGGAAGGGLYVPAGVSHAYIENTVFLDNSCTGGAGGGTSLSSATGGSGGSAVGGGLVSGANLTQMRTCTLATNTIVAGGGGVNSAGGNSGGGGAMEGWDAACSAGVFRVFGTILSGGTNAPNYIPNAFGLTDIGYNISSDASLARLSPTTQLNTDPVLDSGLSDVGPPVGGPFGGPLLTLQSLPGGPGEMIIPGVPGLTFPATDEILNYRGTPTSVGAYELDPIDVTLPGTGAIITYTTNVVTYVISNNPPAPPIDGYSNVITTNTVYTNTVLEPPSIDSPPIDVSTSVGDSATFTVEASANSDSTLNIGFQWQLNGTNLTDVGNFIGSTSNTLTIKKAALIDEGTYTVVVSPSILVGETNASATLTVTAAIIKTQPVSRLGVISGSIVTFRVGTVAGTNFTFQWQFDEGDGTGYNPLSDGDEYSGTATSELIINPATIDVDAGSYEVVITDTTGQATSAAARLTIVSDTRRPSVAITSPVPNARTADPIFKGIASDNAQVASVTYSFTNLNNGLTPGASGYATLSASGTTSKTWTFSDSVLPGLNVLAVQATDPSGNVSPVVTRLFFYKVPAPVSLSTAGSGTGTVIGLANNAQLDVGQTYTVTARPGKNSLFQSWSVTSVGGQMDFTSPTLRFVMESNTTLVANFASNIFLDVSGVYNGLFFDTNDVQFETAGMLANLVLGKTGGYSGKLLLDGSTYNLAGAFDVAGNALEDFGEKPGKPHLALNMYLDTTNAQITGSIIVGSTPIPLMANRAVPVLGSSRYTMLMPAPAGFPAGDGYALISDRNGTATLNGGLADGTTFSQVVPVSSAGDVPVFVSLYNKTGFLLGWINLSNLDNGAALEWIKKGSRPSLVYPAGFTNVLQVEGSRWIAPAPHTPALQIASGALAISNADLDLTFQVSVTDTDAIVKSSGGSNPDNSLTGTIHPATGLLQVVFGNGNGKATSVGWGAVLQDATTAAGYFVSQTNAGSITLQP